MRQARAVAIVGPTATGKTALAIEVAGRLGGEIISADSRQAYRGMMIGTAAPGPQELDSVPHHGIGFLSPGERYSAGRFGRLVRSWIVAIEGRGAVPILAGGTGFFVRALYHPVFREPPLDPRRRAALRSWLQQCPIGQVRTIAMALDPRLADELPGLDRQRSSRAIELALLSGRPLTWWQRHGESEAEPVALQLFSLRLPASEHRARIRARIEAQLAAGWEEEVRRLLAAGWPLEAPGLSAVGYREIGALVRGEIDPQTAAAEIERATWRYARRQRTWFRHQLPETAEWLDARLPTRQLADRITGSPAVVDLRARVGAGPRS